MKGLITASVLFLASVAFAGDINIEGSFTTQFKNDRPNTISGLLAEKKPGTWEGELQTNWKGKIEKYRGTLIGNLRNGQVEGDFFMQVNGTPGRHFVFTATANNGELKGKVTEIRAKGNQGVGEITMTATDVK